MQIMIMVMDMNSMRGNMTVLVKIITKTRNNTTKTTTKPKTMIMEKITIMPKLKMLKIRIMMPIKVQMLVMSSNLLKIMTKITKVLMMEDKIWALMNKRSQISSCNNNKRQKVTNLVIIEIQQMIWTLSCTANKTHRVAIQMIS